MMQRNGWSFRLLAAALLLAAWQGGVFAQQPTTATLNAPTGAVWVSATGAPYRTPLRMTPFLADLKTLPFTDVIVQVRTSADAFYESALAPRAVGVPPQYDPLQILIDEMKAATPPKRVIAWFDPYHAGNLNEAAALGENHVLIEHQDWLSLREDRDSADSNGDMYLEPGLPAVQAHLEAIVRDLVKNYEIGGIYFDHVGDPLGDGKWGYHPDIVERWVARKGIAGAPPASDPEWQAFRAEIITEALRGLVAAAREARPDLSISVGVDAMGPGPSSPEDWRRTPIFQQSRQDFPAWAGLPGVTLFYLKNFHPEPAEAADFNRWLDVGLKIGDTNDAQVGIGVSGEANEALDALKQLRRSAEAGAGGMALWHYGQPVRDAGSRELFMGAVGRTVLSPEFLRSMATIQRSRTERIDLQVVTKQQTQEEGDEAPTATPASQESAAAQDDLHLPPPPRAPEVGDEPGGAPPPSIEEGEGRLLPAAGGGRNARGGIDPETMAALDRLTNPGSVQPATQGEQTTESMRALTLNEMLDQFLKSPRFQQSVDIRLIWRSDEAEVELKKKFGNIF